MHELPCEQRRSVATICRCDQKGRSAKMDFDLIFQKCQQIRSKKIKEKSDHE